MHAPDNGDEFRRNCSHIPQRRHRHARSLPPAGPSTVCLPLSKDGFRYHNANCSPKSCEERCGFALFRSLKVCSASQQPERCTQKDRCCSVHQRFVSQSPMLLPYLLECIGQRLSHPQRRRCVVVSERSCAENCKLSKQAFDPLLNCRTGSTQRLLQLHPFCRLTCQAHSLATLRFCVET